MQLQRVWCGGVTIASMNELSPFDDDEGEAREVIDLWLAGSSEREVAKKLKRLGYWTTLRRVFCRRRL
jgi:hypothetical protein